MGNRVQRQETWEANERGGDYRIKYRSWRQGEPEGGPFNTPTISSASERDRAVSTVQRPTFKDDTRTLLDSAQLEGWIVRPPSSVSRSSSAAEIPARSGAATPTKRRSSLENALVFPPEASTSGGEKKVQRAPSVNELILDELAKAVTDELVGPEYTPVAQPSPKPSDDPSVRSATKANEANKQNVNGVMLAAPPKSSASAKTPPNARGEAGETAEGESVSHVKLVINHLYAPVFQKVKEHLKGLPEWYQAKTPPQEIARHIRTLLEARRCGENEVAVSVAPQYDAGHRVVPGLFVVVVCAKDRRQLLDAITRCVSTRASISEATIVTTGDGFALDRFVLSLRADDDDGSAFDNLSFFGASLKQDIDDVLAATPASPALPPMPPPSGGKSKRKSQQPSSQSQPPPVPESGSYTGRFEVPFQEIRLVKVLGEGRTGKTYLSDWNGQRVAAKVMSIEEQGPPTPSSAKKLKSNLDEFRRELHLVSKLSHPNIVRFVGASARPPRYILLFELCETDLGSLIRQKDRKFSVFQAALDISNGLAFLHRNDIIHRDVKPENLMLDRNGTVKVADFGLSCYASGAAAEITAETGTYRYMAPEVMRHEHYSFPADVYSFALVCYALISRRPPFDDFTPLQAALAVARQDLRPRLPSNLPRGLVDLITGSWNKDPARRPDFETIVIELEEQRGQLNNRTRKQLDWGFHESKKKSLIKSPFTVVSTALSTTAI